MSDSIMDRERKIAEIEEALKVPVLPSSVRQLLEKERLDLLADSEKRSIQGGVNVSDEGRINGVAVGFNLGRIIYGRDPEEDERKRLAWYLSRLAAKLYRLQLRGLDEQLDQHQGVALPSIYVMLATMSKQTVTEERGGINQYFLQESQRNQLKSKYDPMWALPSDAVFVNTTVFANFTRTRISICKALLVTEAVQKYQHLVLLGDPGSGKSTFLRYLAWALARRGLDQPSDHVGLFGWENENLVLPIILPLRTLAGGLAEYDEKNLEMAVYTALRDELQRFNIGRESELLSESLHHRKVLLLFDGLDEVPTNAVSRVADRLTVLRAIRSFVEIYNVPAVMTCRARAFDDSLQSTLGWHVETIAPFTLGQIRHFVPAWYGELVDSGQIEREQAKRLEQKLISAIVGNKKLQEMACTPLLLTMMVLVMYNKNDLPRDRPQLYEGILELLLGQWDKVREGQSLSEAIGQPDWGSDRIRLVLDQLSYQAHLAVSSSDGRGRLARSAVRDALIKFFETARLLNPWESARCCLEYFEQRSGLLIPDEDDTYVFTHLTLQEHCVGRYMLSDRRAAHLVMMHRADDRWREPIFLGLGVIQQTKPELIDRILVDLIDRKENGRNKSADRWQRDLILAAEIGIDRDWNYLRIQDVNVDRLQHDLKQGLVKLLQDKRQLLPATERVRAGYMLGHLGDTRFPITTAQWQMAISRALKSNASKYFCRVEPGTYIIGSAHNDPDASYTEKPQYTVTLNRPFFITRFPITNIQWLEWMKTDEETEAREELNKSKQSNLPVVGITWQQCNDFCARLNEHTGQTIRLPSEIEWETAARGNDGRCYPWGNEWRSDYAAMADGRTGPGLDLSPFVFKTPVGCYPAGSAPNGALDMVGNLWEWTKDEWSSYPGSLVSFAEPDKHVIRGGGTEPGKDVRCAARRGVASDLSSSIYIGFRVVIVPSS